MNQVPTILSSSRDTTPGSTDTNREAHTERNGRKTLTTVQGLPKKFDQKKILKVIKKKFGGLSHHHGSTPTPSEC